jgi:hypothetical protein
MSPVAFVIFLEVFSKQQHLSRKVKSFLYMPWRHTGKQRYSISHSCVMCVVLCDACYCTILYCAVLYCTILYCPVLHGSTLPPGINPFAFNNNKTGKLTYIRGYSTAFSLLLFTNLQPLNKFLWASLVPTFIKIGQKVQKIWAKFYLYPQVKYRIW